MTIPVSASWLALLLCGVLLCAPDAAAQTPGPVQAQPKPANEHKATHPAKPTPVVKPHGTTHAQKPAKQAPGRTRDAPDAFRYSPWFKSTPVSMMPMITPAPLALPRKPSEPATALALPG